jgi:hypothetical protein
VSSSSVHRERAHRSEFEKSKPDGLCTLSIVGVGGIRVETSGTAFPVALTPDSPHSTTTSTMDGWSKLQSSLSTLNIGQSANKFAKGFNSSVQATRERLGHFAPGDITELPQGLPVSEKYASCVSPFETEYKDLETRVDALRQAHLALLK